MIDAAARFYLLRVVQARITELAISMDRDTILYVFQVPLNRCDIRETKRPPLSLSVCSFLRMQSMQADPESS